MSAQQPAAGQQVGLTGSSKRINIIAWSLAAFVVIVGAVMLAVTGSKVFIVFIVLGVLTGVNVVMYDAFVLKPKLAAQARERAEQDRAADTGTPPTNPSAEETS